MPRTTVGRRRPNTRRIPGLAVVLAAASLLLTGCADGTDSAAEVRPIESILASEIDLSFDPTGTTATLEVDTSIPVACAVVYGTDDNFGSIAVDNDMQGGAHHDHRPHLTGLAPDTDYRYVLQGSDAAGTLYRSTTLTFRTPAATDLGLGTNIAPNATVTSVSSEFSPSFAATNAIDGDLGTEWSTAGDGDEAFIEIDLGASIPIVAVAFRTRQMTDGSANTDTFTVTINDLVFGPYSTGTEPALIDEPITARMLRIDAHETTGGNTGATEIEIYGAP